MGLEWRLVNHGNKTVFDLDKIEGEFISDLSDDFSWVTDEELLAKIFAKHFPSGNDDDARYLEYFRKHLFAFARGYKPNQFEMMTESESASRLIFLRYDKNWKRNEDYKIIDSRLATDGDIAYYFETGEIKQSLDGF